MVRDLFVREHNECLTSPPSVAVVPHGHLCLVNSVLSEEVDDLRYAALEGHPTEPHHSACAHGARSGLLPCIVGLDEMLEGLQGVLAGVVGPRAQRGAVVLPLLLPLLAAALEVLHAHDERVFLGL